MPAAQTSNLLVVLSAGAALGWLLRPRWRANVDWRATLTPLASIIGSGFLVLAPLLLRHFGVHAATMMVALCVLAYALGAAIRYNIAAVDDGIVEPPPLAAVETAASWALAFAYVVSVAYYLNLLGAFALAGVGGAPAGAARGLATAMLILVAGLGWRGGLRALERAESFSVALKLAVIVGLLAGMTAALGTTPATGGRPPEPVHAFDALRLAFGMVITVQGFETSRYLRGAYDPATRVRTMRRAQVIASLIYVVYIALAARLFDAGTVPSSETAIIGLTAGVASVLPPMLVVAALAAQFSAAVADTSGCGGLVHELSGRRVPPRLAYVALALGATLLTWSADVFQIISHASRAFALYYALQCTLAAARARQRHQALRSVGFAMLAAVMAAATLLGIPAG
jgi:hypothetical protein